MRLLGYGLASTPMTTTFLITICLSLLAVVIIVWQRGRRAVLADYIRSYMFPPGLLEKLHQRRPTLETKDLQLVAHGLRQFFLAHLKSGRKFVSMPSQVADDLWHEFILYTRHYEVFCRQAFGQFMHHTPAVVLGSNRSNNTGLRRIWWYTCLEENINPRKATRLPLLFALDSKLGVADGFQYAVDCSVLRKGGSGAAYCGGDFGSSAIDGSTDGFGDGSSTDSAADGSGDSGCGGGCGGGD